MNKEQYNNIIKASLNEDNLQCENNLEAVRTVFNNMGVALPQGDFSKVSETLATDDYMNWKSCSQEEAQEYANQGVPAIRIDETNIQLISAEETDDSVEGVATTSSVLFNNNDLVIEELEPISKEPTYYAYSRSSTPNTGSSQFIPNGTYYMNSAYTGRYLQKESNNVKGISGLLTNLGNSIKWTIEKTGSYYTIRYAADTTKYLGVASVDPDSAIVNIYTINSSTVPDYCKWTPAKGTDSVGGVVFKNLFNSRYLACAASILTRPSLGADPSIPYLQCTWRIISTAKYGNTSGYESRELGASFSIQNHKLGVGESSSPIINKSPEKALWATAKDFNFSFDSDKISISNGEITGIKRGYVTVTATHKVTCLTTQFEVFVNNPLLDSTDISSLRTRFTNAFGNGYLNNNLVNSYTVSEALDMVIAMDDTITNYCNEFGLPKEFVQTVLFKEIWCYNTGDTAKDVAVRATYTLCEQTNSAPLIDALDDSSTGLGQIFARTAINALNNADERGFINLSSRYSTTNWRDVWEVWQNLNENDTYNIKCCTLVLLDCQYEFQSTIPYRTLFDLNATKIKTILARYNGTVNSGTGYGEDTYPYFEIFKSFI